MKTNELKQKLENIGLMFEDDLKDILISNEWCNTVCSISKEYVACFNIDWFHSSSISENKRKDLIKIVTEYSLTPIEEREIEPKYKLALRIVNNQVDEDSQLILLWDSRFNRIEVGKCASVKYIVRYMKHVDKQPYKDIHYIYTQKEWEEKLKTSWETITFIYQPIMIK